MRKAFTMIELIFVIVILSIIAVVAVPRLAATRDDAEVAKAAMNIRTLIADIGSYYTAQGKFSVNISDMSNVLQPIYVKRDKCLDITALNSANGTISVDLSTSGLCEKVWSLPALESTKELIAGTAGGTKDVNTIRFGGTGIKYQY